MGSFWEVLVFLKVRDAVFEFTLEEHVRVFGSCFSFEG